MKEYVEWVNEKYIILYIERKKHLKLFETVKWKPCLFKRDYWKTEYSSEIELAKIFNILRNEKVLLAWTPGGWSPGAIFEELRDKGLISGKYDRIFWSGKGKYDIQRNC